MCLGVALCPRPYGLRVIGDVRREPSIQLMCRIEPSKRSNAHPPPWAPTRLEGGQQPVHILRVVGAKHSAPIEAAAVAGAEHAELVGKIRRDIQVSRDARRVDPKLDGGPWTHPSAEGAVEPAVLVGVGGRHAPRVRPGLARELAGDSIVGSRGAARRAQPYLAEQGRSERIALLERVELLHEVLNALPLRLILQRTTALLEIRARVIRVHAAEIGRPVSRCPADATLGEGLQADGPGSTALGMNKDHA